MLYINRTINNNDKSKNDCIYHCSKCLIFPPKKNREVNFLLRRRVRKKMISCVYRRRGNRVQHRFPYVNGQRTTSEWNS